MKKFLSFFKLLICICICATSLTSCFTTKVTEVRQDDITVNDFPEFRKQCIGTTYNQIVTKLGAPQRTLSDGNGGTILVYENTTTTTISQSLATAYNVNVFTKTYTPGAETTTQQTTKTDYIQYFVDANNTCYEVKTNIPMTHTEKSAPYEYTRKKVKWGKTLGVWIGSYAAFMALCLIPAFLIK